ncbi:hypothetical protein FOA52_004833 [Chlamydomonas sp. UWO 241]|nr:hypothetical protein FOA52_004833 [Chlamydomonas sp. UWO 241]
MATVSPEMVLKLDKPVDGFLCPLEANTFGIEFLEFQIKDYTTKKTVYASPGSAGSESMLATAVAGDEAMRSVKYTFPADFLTYQTIRTALRFKVGDQPANNFRMIELHYFKNKLVRVYDFTFGFCIPNSTNSWEAIYDVPKYTKQQIADYVETPYSHTSDSYYFVDGKLIMHNKAEYKYA